METGGKKYYRKQFKQKFRVKIFERDNYECQRCGKNLIHLPDDRKIYYKIPLSKGGSNSINNLWLLCDWCDKHKKDNIDEDLAQEYIKARMNYLERTTPIKIKKEDGNSGGKKV